MRVLNLRVPGWVYHHLHNMGQAADGETPQQVAVSVLEEFCKADGAKAPSSSKGGGR